MKQYIRMLTCLFWLGLISVASAQTRTITGNVTDDQGVPLPGATILEQGTANGVTTDFDGNFSMEVADGATLEVSFVGYESQTQSVGADSTYSFQMASGNLLEEVVVTSLGIKREAKALGYAEQNVTSETIAKSNATDALAALTGQAAGVKITNVSGSAGAGSRIVIRGQTSLSGNNQALIIVDGVRIDNSQFATEGRNAGVAGSNRGMDINPADIESINVLKGGSAAALYGVDGCNGVIVITTKKGKSVKKSS